MGTALAWSREAGYLSDKQLMLMGVDQSLIDLMQVGPFEKIVETFACQFPDLLIVESERNSHLREMMPGTRMDS